MKISTIETKSYVKKSKIWTVIGIVGILLLLLTFASPILIMYYAEEQFFIDQYKKNKTAFNDVKDDLLYTLEKENVSDLNLVVDYDSKKGLLLQHYDRTSYSVDYSHPIDANSESYVAVNESFGDYSFSKIYVTNDYICLSEENNNFQYIYSSECKPKSAHYASSENDKIHSLGDNWYLVTPD